MKFLEKRGFKLKEVVPGIILAVACCFMLFLYAPLELYFTNKIEFWFDFYTLAPIMAVVFLITAVLSIIGIIVLRCIHKKLYQVGLVAAFIAFIATYIQGNYLIKNLPPLDGTTVDWSQYSGERIKSIILWVVVIAVVLALIKFMHVEKFYSVVKIVSACIFLMLCVTLVTVGLTNEGVERKLQVGVTDKNMFEMSDDTNFIIFVVDAVDARTMTMLMEQHPEYADVFEDFTYYPNTVGAYAFTQESIPFILSGEWFEHEQTYEEYCTEVFRDSKLFSNLEEKGYTLGLYDNGVISSDESVFRFENIGVGIEGVSNNWEFVKAQIKLVGLKYAPFDLKRVCIFDTNYFDSLQKPSEDENLFLWDNQPFYQSLQTTRITHTEEKCFKFIHIEGGHIPFRYDANVNIVEDATYESNVEAAVTIIKTYLEKLKNEGVYDNTAIMILSDHGYMTYEEGGEVPAEVTVLLRHNPALFVKGVNEEHEFEISNAPISFVDLQEAYARLIEGKGGEEVFDAREGDERKRRYLFYIYPADHCFEEYYIEGDAWDSSSLYSTGQFYTK